MNKKFSNFVGLFIAIAIVCTLVTSFIAPASALATPTPTPTPTPTHTPPPTPTPIPNPSCTPAPPCSFYGLVQVNGSNVANGTVIQANVKGDIYTTTTPSQYGPSTYLINISPNDCAGYNPGTLVNFMIGNLSALQTGSWEVLGNILLDLTAQSITPTPTLRTRSCSRSSRT